MNGKKCNYLFKNHYLKILPGQSKKNNQIVLDFSLPMDSLYTKKEYFIGSYFLFPNKDNNRVELSINARIPSGYKYYSNGNVILKTNGSDSVYTIHNNLVKYYAVILAPNNRYEKIEKTIKNKKLKFYFIDTNKNKQDSIINDLIVSYKNCENKIGDYNRNEFVFIEYPDLDYCNSMEGFLVSGRSWVYYYNRFPGMNFWTSHEIVHQWFGSGVYLRKTKTKISYRNFLSESLSEFIRWTNLEDVFKNDTLQKNINYSIIEYENQIKGSKNDEPISADLPNRVTYACGPIIYYYIRNKIGKDNWHKLLRDYYNTYKGKFATFDDFELELSKYMSKADIKTMHSYLDNKFSFFLSQFKNE